MSGGGVDVGCNFSWYCKDVFNYLFSCLIYGYSPVLCAFMCAGCKSVETGHPASGTQDASSKVGQ